MIAIRDRVWKQVGTTSLGSLELEGLFIPKHGIGYEFCNSIWEVMGQISRADIRNSAADL